jgi:threonine synthase
MQLCSFNIDSSSHVKNLMASEELPHLVDDSGKHYDVMAPCWSGDGGSPVMLTPLPGIQKQDIDTKQRGLWRYRRSFALDYPRPISLGEGGTPLVAGTYDGLDLHFKLEWFNPTGSFKDRGSSLVASTLAVQGITNALTDSSGNGGSSLSAFCARAGIGLKVLVPATTSPSKVTQARAYGAEVELIEGGRDLVQAAALEQAAKTFYAGHNWHPFFLDGVKTIGYELWEDLGFSAPDNIVVVTGAGSIALGCDAAFGELLRAGQIASRPRLLLAQPESCRPIYDTFHSVPLAQRHYASRSLAEGAAIPAPVRLGHVIEAVRRSQGTVVSVTEAEIRDATRKLASMGLYCEPTSAVAAAAVRQLRDTGTIQRDQSTVVILTGTGLKASASMDTIFNA